MQISADLDKSVAIVKPSSDLVLFEDLNAQGAFIPDGMINHHPAESLPVPRRVEKQPAYLIAKQRDETNDATFEFQYPGFRMRKVLCPQIGCLPGYEFIAQKWMGKGTGGLPYRNEPLGIAWTEFPDHRAGRCTGCCSRSWVAATMTMRGGRILAAICIGRP